MSDARSSHRDVRSNTSASTDHYKGLEDVVKNVVNDKRKRAAEAQGQKPNERTPLLQNAKGSMREKIAEEIAMGQLGL